MATQPWRDLFALDQFPVAWLPVVPGYLATVVLVGLVWCVGCVVFRSRNGVLAAVLPLSVRFAHLAITDVPAALWIVAAVLFSVRFTQEGRRRDALLAGRYAT